LQGCTRNNLNDKEAKNSEFEAAAVAAAATAYPSMNVCQNNRHRLQALICLTGHTCAFSSRWWTDSTP